MMFFCSGVGFGFFPKLSLSIFMACFISLQVFKFETPWAFCSFCSFVFSISCNLFCSACSFCFCSKTFCCSISCGVCSFWKFSNLPYPTFVLAPNPKSSKIVWSNFDLLSFDIIPSFNSKSNLKVIFGATFINLRGIGFLSGLSPWGAK